MSNQPVWKFVANIGDRGFLDYGGFFVYEDTTGVYAPEAEVLEVENEGEQDDDKLTYTIYRFSLDQCTYTNGILSDNKFHPDHEVWFGGRELRAVAASAGQEVEELVEAFCSNDCRWRAFAYQSVALHFGYEEFDSYPLTGLSRAEVEERYKKKNNAKSV